MKELKFRYVFVEASTYDKGDAAYYEEIETKIVTLEELEQADSGHYLDELLVGDFGVLIRIIARNLYTGQKDRNGNDIYEGDIVRDCFTHPEYPDDWHNHYLGPSKKGEVIWDDSHAGFHIKTDRWEEDAKLFSMLGKYTNHQIISEWVEVIGNIYKNSDLIMDNEK